jgi:hypothetical protein
VDHASGDELAERRADADADGGVMAPSWRLKRPVPRVRSAITRTETTPKIPAPTPSRNLNGHEQSRA